ncbi:MAG TPA: plastocyanin/azurin family copper-binding protein [Nitrososphaeraceae archaeon]|jgi:plastocyanin
MTNILLFVTVMALFTTILGSNPGNYYAFAQEGFQTEDLVNETIELGNTTTSNATLAFAQEQVSIAPGSSNPSATQFYVPPEITISAGTAVTWTNDDSTIHTVTEGTPGGAGATPAFDSSIIAPSVTWEHTFDAAGEFDYYCTLHPFMTGKVTAN